MRRRTIPNVVFAFIPPSVRIVLFRLTRQISSIAGSASLSRRATRQIGTDTGFDCIGDWPQAAALSNYLDLLDRENSLPRMVIYNVNPADNYAFATVAGNFHDGAIAGKIQFGSGWWFLDQKE